MFALILMLLTLGAIGLVIGGWLAAVGFAADVIAAVLCIRALAKHPTSHQP